MNSLSAPGENSASAHDKTEVSLTVGIRFSVPLIDVGIDKYAHV